MKKILVIAPHPDDETLGCGGTLLKHQSKKDKISWCIVTFGNKDMGHDNAHMKKWDKIVNEVKKKYKMTDVFKLGYPTGALDQVPFHSLIDSIKKVIKKVKPDIIYINFSHDIHTDHQIIFQSFMSAVKNFNFPNVKKILLYETPSETEFAINKENITFVPNYFVDISKFLDKKLSIFSIYKSEVMKNNFPRSIKNIQALAKYRGGRIGKKYAEAFMLVFSIE